MTYPPLDGAIIETSCNRLFRVSDHPDARIDHAWLGIEVKRIRSPMGDSYEPKVKAREQLVRKAATRIIEAF